MTLTQSEIDSTLEKIHENIHSVFLTKDIEKILDLFDENGVVIHRGSGVMYGREDLQKFYEGCLKVGPPLYRVIPTKSLATSNGEYLIQEGALEFDIGEETKRCNFVAVFKKDEKTGEYKYFRNEVDVKNMY